MSLKCMIDKWLHKGQISQEEYDAVIKKLDGHDKQVRNDTIDECLEVVDKIIDKCVKNGGCRSKCDEPYACVFGIDVMGDIEQLKENNNEYRCSSSN